MLEQVWAAIDEGRNGEARALLEADPTLLASGEGQHTLGHVLAHEGLFEEAREVYTRLRDAYAGQPNEHIFVHQLGMVERLAGNFRLALDLFIQELALIETLPEKDRAWKRAVNGYELGVCHLALGEVGEARAALDVALKEARLVNDSMTLGCVHRALGDLAAHVGDADTAQNEYDLALAAFKEAGAERVAGDVQECRDRL